MLGKYIKLGGAVAGGRGRDTNRYTSSGALRIAYELQGTMHRRRPWLVLVHGMGFDRSGWDPVLPALRRRFRLVLLDNRGTGRSGRPDRSFNVADMAADVVAVLDAVSIGWANVLGASLGGMVAQELAITRPERVARLVLACTTPGWPAVPPCEVRLRGNATGNTEITALKPELALRPLRATSGAYPVSLSWRCALFCRGAQVLEILVCEVEPGG